MEKQLLNLKSALDGKQAPTMGELKAIIRNTCKVNGTPTRAVVDRSYPLGVIHMNIHFQDTNKTAAVIAERSKNKYLITGVVV